MNDSTESPSPKAGTTAAVILAAGEGRRFAESGGIGPKLLAMFRNRPIIDTVLDTVHEAASSGVIDEVIVVEGAVDLSERAGDATLLHNPGWTDGLATSLAVAIDYAKAVGHDAVVVGLGDQPGITSSAWAAVASAPAEPPIAVATYCGRRGHPTRLHRTVWDRLPSTGDDGARHLIADHPELVNDIPCAGTPRDIDTKEDINAWI